jgi:hypothetical protein
MFLGKEEGEVPIFRVTFCEKKERKRSDKKSEIIMERENIESRSL